MAGRYRPWVSMPDASQQRGFFPTMLEMAGARPEAGQGSDGVSLVPLLKQTGTLARKEIYWHYPHYSNQGGKPGGAIRQGITS